MDEIAKLLIVLIPTIVGSGGIVGVVFYALLKLKQIKNDVNSDNTQLKKKLEQSTAQNIALANVISKQQEQIEQLNKKIDEAMEKSLNYTLDVSNRIEGVIDENSTLKLNLKELSKIKQQLTALLKGRE